jgi:hypothetical protein
MLPLLLMLLELLEFLEMVFMLMVFSSHSDNSFLFGEDTCDTGCYFVMDYGFLVFAHNVDSEFLLKG